MPDKNDPVSDIVMIGSGIASTSTLIALFELLLADKTPNRKTMIITVVERYTEMWKGIPYGNRSSVNALTITTINDFFTSDQERISFFDWFLPNKDTLLEKYAISGGDVAQTWLKENNDHIEKNDWGNVYLPRFIVGEYLAQKLEHLRKLVETKGMAEISTVHGDARAIKQVDDLKKVIISSGPNELCLLAKKVVLAIGSAPVKKLTNAFDRQSEVLYINDLHQQTREETTRDIINQLGRSTANEKNILIIGANASAIEFLYLLNHTRELKDISDNITLLSTGGKLPGHITYNNYGHSVTANLDLLAKKETYSLGELVAAAMADIIRVTTTAVSVPDVDRIMATTIKLLEPLDEESKKLFYAVHGVELARAFRRSGTDYKKATDNLSREKKLIFIKGKYAGIEYKGDGLSTLCYFDDENVKVILNKKFSVVINCTGADDLEDSLSLLIKDLLVNNDFKVNASRKAFLVNDKLEGAPGVYVIGPLVGGNYNKLLYFWHLENASRIIYLSKHLAPELLN